MSNSSNPDDLTCHLSPHARALSTVLTAFVGSIIGGLSGGSQVAFFTAWVCWFATLRIVSAGVWAVFEAIRFKRVRGGDQFHEFYSRLPVIRVLLCHDAKIFDDPFFREGAQSSPPTVLGWVGWLFATCYAPVSQILWLVGNWNSASGQLKFVRAIGVSVTALPLTIDTKARYGVALEKYLGSWSSWLFGLMTAMSCLTLGVLSSLLLILTVIDLKPIWYTVLTYIFFLVVWTQGSFSFQVPHDESYSANTVPLVLGGLGMGLFGGIFVAWPALIVMQTAPSSPGRSLASYIACERVAVWRKFIALFP